MPNWLTDQRGVMHASGKALFYHSPPLAADTDLAGFFKLSAWISLDQPDTDFVRQPSTRSNPTAAACS